MQQSQHMQNHELIPSYRKNIIKAMPLKLVKERNKLIYFAKMIKHRAKHAHGQYHS